MKKRFLMMMLAGVLAFSMIGCGGGEAEQEDPNTGDEIVDVEGDVEGEAGDAESEADGEQEGEAGQEEPEVQKPIEQKPEVQDPVVDEPEVGGEEENAGDAEGGVVIDKAFADMTLEEMILASYANIELPFTGEMEIDKTDADAVAFYLGTNDVTFKRGVVSEAMISSIAHSVVVLEMEDAAAAEAAAATLKETAPVGKWVCVVPDQVGTAHRGNIVMMAMSNSADAILANFNALQ